MKDFVGQLLSDNPHPGPWVATFATWVVAIFILRFARGVFGARLKPLAVRTGSRWLGLGALLIQKTHGVFLAAVVLFFVAGTILDVPPLGQGEGFGAPNLLAVIFLLQSFVWIHHGIDYLLKDYRRRLLEKDAEAVTLISSVAFIGKLVLHVLIFLMVLQNLTIPIGSLLAGLGVAGIAVGLALQNVLGDLFASMAIVLDKPFVIGDFIIVDDKMGSVEQIGLKTTRLRSLSGEQLIFSNNDLLKSRIRNYKRMFERRVLFTIGVTYRTPHEKLAMIGTMIRQIIEEIPRTRFDRAHFKEYGESSLNFEVVYFVLAPDHGLYMDIHQKINLAIFERFEHEGIEFAYPTRTLYVQRTDSIQAMTDKQTGV